MSPEDVQWYRQLLGKTIDDFYVAKFDAQGEVRPEWNFNEWMLKRTAAWGKRPSKGCHTVIAH